jgi:hypothetical protein
MTALDFAGYAYAAGYRAALKGKERVSPFKGELARLAWGKGYDAFIKRTKEIRK